MRYTRSLLTTMALSTLLTGCGTKFATQPPVSAPQPVELPAPPPLPPADLPTPTDTTTPVIRPTKRPDTEQARSLPAAISLRNQAQSAAKDGNHTRAIGLLERAIRISPTDPATFQALAESHLAMERPRQALELTRRALNLNPNIEQRISLETLARRCEAML